MSCPVCFTATAPADRFCGRCGYALARSCERCGQTVQPSDQFCRSCGQALGPNLALPKGHHLSITSAPIPGPPATAQPIDLPPAIGEHKVVTVFFADVVGSTRLIEHMEPEQSMRLLEPALQMMFDAVRRFGGTINRVQGDGIMALFGAPVAHEDHAVRACLSALQLARAARSLAAHGINIRIGINSGPVVVRSYGNDMSINYDAVGATVHLAARMEQTCEPGSIRLAAGTFRLAEHAIVVRALGAVEIRGMSLPIEVYELLDRAPERQRGARHAAGPQSRFVNRVAELALMRQSMELCAVGFGQVVSIAGPPGIGKSRIVREFTRAILPDSWQRLETACSPYDQNTTYYPLKVLLRLWSGIGASDDYAAATDAVRRALASVDERLSGELAPICSLLDLPVEDPAWEQLAPQMRQRRIIASVCDVLIAIAQSRPLVIFVEDVHWIDTETRSVLEELSRRIGQATCLLLLTARPDSPDLDAEEANYRRIEIQALDAGHAATLSDDLLGVDGSLADLKRRIIERTGGVPLFIEETIAALIAARDIERARRGYRLTRQIDAIRIPETLQALVTSRIDRLAPEPKAILQLAAVVGNEVPAVLLSHIAGTAEDRLTHALRRLETGDFLRRVENGQDTAFAFRHAIVRDVAYKSLLGDQRSALHRSVVDAIEACYRNRHDEHVERLAQHAFAGELWIKAADYSRKAADKAYERSALHDAVSFLEQTLSALERLPANREFLARAVEARIRLRKALWTLGRVEDADAHLDRAEALATLLDDKRTLAEISVIRAQVLNSQGEVDRAVAAGLKACEVSEAIGNEAFLMGAKFFLSQSYYFRGDLRQSIEVVEPHRLTITGRLRHERLATILTTSVLHLVNLARAYALLGRFELARKHAEEARVIARETSRPFDIGFADHAAGVTAAVKGDYKETVRILEPALALCEAHELMSLFPLVASPLGFAHACLGNSNYGGALVARAVEVAGQSRLRFFRVWSASYQARAYHEAGAVEETLAAGQEALAEAVARNFRTLDVRLRWLVGSAAGYGDPMAGLAQLQQAAQLATELEMRPDLAHCRRAMATIYYRLGREGEADAERVAAFGIYKQLGMRYGETVNPPVTQIDVVDEGPDLGRARY